MRTVLAAGLFVAVAGLAVAADEKYTSKDGKFAVKFPADAKVETAKQDAGGLPMMVTTVNMKDTAYAVIFADLPEAAKSIPAKQILDGAQKGAVDKSGGKLLDSKDINFGPKKFPGRDVVVEKDGNKIRTWVIIADTRLYVVVVGGAKDFATGKDGDKFLESFEITK